MSKMLSHMEVDRKQRAWAETGSRMTFKGLPHMAYFLQWNRLPFRGSRTSLAGGQDSNRFYGRHFLLKPQCPFCSHLGSVFTHKAKHGALHIASSRERREFPTLESDQFIIPSVSTYCRPISVFIMGLETKTLGGSQEEMNQTPVSVL